MIAKSIIGTTPGTSHLTTRSRESSWYAFYTSPRAEKRAAGRLEELGIEHYLPLVKTLQQWSDRKKMVEKPLINSYIFVKTDEHLLREITGVQGISRYISFEGRPAAIPGYQIDNLRLLVDSNAEIEVTGEKLGRGDNVEVTHGTLRGVRGELVKISGNNRVVVRIDNLNLNLIVTIQKAFLKKAR